MRDEQDKSAARPKLKIIVLLLFSALCLADLIILPVLILTNPMPLPVHDLGIDLRILACIYGGSWLAAIIGLCIVIADLKGGLARVLLSLFIATLVCNLPMFFVSYSASPRAEGKRAAANRSQTTRIELKRD